jgi:hypothetical protein
MRRRLEVDNPFYSGEASASAFGWQFQVDAAIFLFLHYIDEVERITVEGKYQDIELFLKDKKHIYAQAKSIQNGSLQNRTKKLEDAVISLAKTPIDIHDDLLYISNYEAPIKRRDLFKNTVVRLKNVADEKRSFQEQINKLTGKLEKHIASCDKNKKKKYEELLRRIKAIDIDNFMVSTVYPYVVSEPLSDIHKQIENKLNDVLSNKFNITSGSLQRTVKNVLLEWHNTFLINACTPCENIYKNLNKTDLLWQIVVVLSDCECTPEDLIDDDLDEDTLSEYDMYYAKKLIIHERFEFVNNLMNDYKEYRRIEKKDKKQFVLEKWVNYEKEFVEFLDCSKESSEYLIKKYLYSMLNRQNNIRKIVEGRSDDN